MISSEPKTVVVMPTLKRPEFLALALLNLSQNPNSQQLDVRIFLDYTKDAQRIDEVAYVRDTYFPTADIFFANPHVDAPSGCWNILNALKQGYETGADLIFLVEEDVMVRPWFIGWHTLAHQQGDYFATCGRLRKEHSSAYYTNPGSCIRRDKLSLVIPHICDAYFADRRYYLDSVFGSMDEASDLDDGLIRRVIRQQNAQVLYPDEPSCSHAGFHFFGRFQEFKTEGTIQERICQLKELFLRIKPTDRYTKDFEPFSQ